jgi:hypothetical protein
MDQDLRQSEAWLVNRWPLVGVMAGLSLLAHHHRPIIADVAGRRILLGNGVAPKGARYADRLKGWMNLAPIIGQGCRFLRDGQSGNCVLRLI